MSQPRLQALASIAAGVFLAVLFAPTSISPGLDGVHTVSALPDGDGDGLLTVADDHRRVPAPRPEVPVVRDEALLDKIVAALEARDGASASAAIDRWLAAGREGVDDLLWMLGADRDDARLDTALAAVLKRAVVDAARYPEAFAPWTPNAIVAGALGVLDASVGNARVLYAGLGDLGRFATAEQLVGLVHYQGGGGDRITDQAHQIDTIRLMQAWATEPTLAPEPLLDALFADPASTPLARARAASLLLHRDWRTHAATIVENLGALEAEDPWALQELGQDVRAQLGSFARYLDGPEQAEYLALIVGDERAFRRTVESIEPEAALRFLATADTTAVGPLQLAALELRAGGDRAIDAALSLLPSLSEQPDFSAHACVHQIVQLDGAADPAVQSMLEELFERREERRDPFWQALAWHPQSLSDRQVEEAIVPWLYLSAGERHSTRERLVAHVQQRFPGRFESL